MVPKMRHVHGPIRTSSGVLLPTTNQMASSPFPRPISIHVGVTAARAPNRRRDAMALAHRCPRHHDEHRGQDEGTGQEQGRAGRSPCPRRALHRGHLRSFTASHGQSKLLLNGSVLRRSCSPQALDAVSIPVTHSTFYYSWSIVCGNESSGEHWFPPRLRLLSALSGHLCDGAR